MAHRTLPAEGWQVLIRLDGLGSVTDTATPMADGPLPAESAAAGDCLAGAQWVSVIDAPRRVIYTTASGVVRAADTLDHQAQIVGHPCFDATFSRVLDFREVSQVELTVDDIERLSHDRLFAPTARRALVASKPIALGLVLIYGLDCDSAAGGDVVDVFRTIEDALEWVDVA